MCCSWPPSTFVQSLGLHWRYAYQILLNATTIIVKHECDSNDIKELLNRFYLCPIPWPSLAVCLPDTTECNHHYCKARMWFQWYRGIIKPIPHLGRGPNGPAGDFVFVVVRSVLAGWKKSKEKKRKCFRSVQNPGPRHQPFLSRMVSLTCLDDCRLCFADKRKKKSAV